MRRRYQASMTAAVLMLAAAGVQAQEVSRSVADGGVKVPGWQGSVDPKEASRAGAKVTDAMFMKTGDAFHVTTGPAMTYWNPANKASGDYTVKATFVEPKYMSLNDHPHPYGIVIGGNDMGTPNETYLYCAAYGNGTFIMRGFSPTAFSVNGRGAPAASIAKAAAKGDQVKQEIAVSVKGGKVSCSVNGAVVGEYENAMVVGEGKAKSTDGLYGLRFGHNTEAIVTGLSVSKN